MLNVRKPKARTLGSRGYTISTKKNLIDHSPVTDDSYENPFGERTPGSEIGSAFESVPHSPPKIKRIVRVGDPISLTSLCDSSLERKTFATPKRVIQDEKAKFESPCDTTQATSVPSNGTPLANSARQKKSKTAWGKNSTNFKNQIKQIKKNLPKTLKPKSRSISKKSSIDLADLTIATICVVPRHGAGIAIGRKTFERMRTSLMLHMVQDCQNASWDNNGESEGLKNGKGQVAKLNTLLRNCINDKETCFVEKSQETVRLAKDGLQVCLAVYDCKYFQDWFSYSLRIDLLYDCHTQEFEDVSKSLVKTELGQRNLTCAKFLSGMYQDVINDEKNISSRDGLALMIVGSAYYALGKFEPALSVYQRAGSELMKKISTSAPEYTVHCAKLFNNMGCVYFEMNKYEKAMHTFQRALQLFHNDGDNDYASWSAAILDQASIMNNMAYTLIKFKQYDDASDLVDASFELQQILPGNTNTMLISTLSSMAFIYYRTKKYRQSLDTYSGESDIQMLVQTKYAPDLYNTFGFQFIVTKTFVAIHISIPCSMCAAPR